MPVLLRTNLFTDPRSSALTAWLMDMGGGSASMSRSTTGGPFTNSAGAFTKVTWTTSPSVAGGGIGGVVSSGIVPGVTYYIFTYIMQSIVQTVQFRAIWKDSVGGIISVVNGSAPGLAANAWNSISMTSTAPANAASLIVSCIGASTIWPVNSWIGMSSILVEDNNSGASQIGAYFDGTSTDTNNTRTYAWTGTADASTSICSSILQLKADFYSLSDIQYAFWKAKSGIVGSMADVMRAGFRAGVSSPLDKSLEDAEMQYWKNQLAPPYGSVNDLRNAQAASSGYPDVRSYYASFFK